MANQSINVDILKSHYTFYNNHNSNKNNFEVRNESVWLVFFALILKFRIHNVLVDQCTPTTFDSHRQQRGFVTSPPPPTFYLVQVVFAMIINTVWSHHRFEIFFKKMDYLTKNFINHNSDNLRSLR